MRPFDKLGAGGCLEGAVMEFEQVATGYCLIEAPRWDERGLWFTDILLGGVHRLRPDGQTDSWLTERKIMGGLALNDDGRVICSGTGSIAWFDPETGASGTLLDTIDGEPVNGVNDIFPDGKGGLYLGTVDHRSMLSGGEFYGTSELCRLDPDGKVTKLHGGMMFSNGMGLSPDGRTVYMTDSGVGVYAHALDPDGSVRETTLFFPEPGGDGLAVDGQGGVWSAGIQSGELTRILPDGTVDRRIPIPGGHPVALCFGGPDYRDLYVTTAAPGAGEAALDHSRIASVPRTAGIYRARSEIAGFTSGKTSFRLPR
jgi:sugar lactone lactonase YvrE